MEAENLFGTRNLYKILQLNQGAGIQDGKRVAFLVMNLNKKPDFLFIAVKKSYYKLARLFHPDRVSTTSKEEAKRKFNIIHNAYAILSDAEKKKQYDDGTDIIFTKATMAARWENFLKPIDDSAIETARKKYQGSDAEENDIARECVTGKGSITHLLNNIPFMRVEDENRIIEIIKKLMDENKIPKMMIKKIRK